MTEGNGHWTWNAQIIDAQRVLADEALRKSEAQLREFALRLITVREAEAARISREIHDQMGQALTALKMEVQSFEVELRGSRDWIPADELA